MERTKTEWEAAIGVKISEVLQDTVMPSTRFTSITHPTDKLFPSAIDHTLLKPDATPAQIDQLCDEAIKYGFKVTLYLANSTRLVTCGVLSLAALTESMSSK